MLCIAKRFSSHVEFNYSLDVFNRFILQCLNVFIIIINNNNNNNIIIKVYA